MEAGEAAISISLAQKQEKASIKPGEGKQFFSEGHAALSHGNFKSARG